MRLARIMISLTVALLITVICQVIMLQACSASECDVLGSNYQLDSTEISYQTNDANFIATVASNGFDVVKNNYGSNGLGTSQNTIYSAASGSGVNSSSFYVGHGSSGVGYSCPCGNGVQYAIVTNAGGWAYDCDIYSNSIQAGDNERFAVIWACDAGDTRGYLQQYSCGSWFVTGMPYAWLHTNSMSSNGYQNPDGTKHCFIGFNGDAPFLDKALQYTNDTSLFLCWFYSHLFGLPYTVNMALDSASMRAWGQYFNNCPLQSNYHIVVYGDGGMYLPNGPTYAMKTQTNGYFYIPKVTPLGTIKVEMLFDGSAAENLTGDQTGGTSPYSHLSNYPDGTVGLADLNLITNAYGSTEGSSKWNYMADIVPDGKIGLTDLVTLNNYYGKSGTYSKNFAGVSVLFGSGVRVYVDSNGYAPIDQPNERFFTVEKNGNPIGAMCLFWVSGRYG